MPFLRDPQTSGSHRSWRTLVSYGDARLIVQCRTAEGLKKNQTWSHKLAYKDFDLEPYRIIVNTGLKERLVVGISKSEEGIMKQWKELEAILKDDEIVAGDPESYLSNKVKWKELYARIPSVNAPLKGLTQSYQAFLNTKIQLPDGGASVGSRSTVPPGSPVESMSPTSATVAGFTSSRASAPPSSLVAGRSFLSSKGSASSAAQRKSARYSSKYSKFCAPGCGAIYGGLDDEDEDADGSGVQFSYLEAWVINSYSTWTWSGTGVGLQGTRSYIANSCIMYAVLAVAVWTSANAEPQGKPLIPCSWGLLACSLVFSGLHLPSLLGFLVGITGVLPSPEDADVESRGGEEGVTAEDTVKLQAVQNIISGLGLQKNGAFQSVCCAIIVLDFIATSFLGEALLLVQSDDMGKGGSAFLGSLVDVLAPVTYLPSLISSGLLVLLTATLVIRMSSIVGRKKQKSDCSPISLRTTTATTAGEQRESSSSSFTDHRDSSPSPTRPATGPNPSRGITGTGPTTTNNSISEDGKDLVTDPVIRDLLDLVNSSGWEFDASTSSKEDTREKEPEQLRYYTKSVPWCDKKAIKLSILCPNSTPETLEHVACQDVDSYQVETQSPTAKRRAFGNSYASQMDPRLKFKNIKFWVEDGKYFVEHMGFKSYLPTSDERDVVNVVNPRYYLTEKEQEAHSLKVSDDELRKASCDPFEPCVFVQATVSCERLEEKQRKKSGNNKLASSYPTVKKNPDYERATMFVSGVIAQRVAAGTLVTMCWSYDPCGLFPAFAVDMINTDKIENAKSLRRMMMAVGPKEPAEEEMDKLACTRRNLTSSALILGLEAKAKKNKSSHPTTGDSNNVEGEEDEAGLTDVATKALGLPSHEDCPIIAHCLKNMNSKEWKVKQDKDGVVWQERGVNYCDKKALLFTMKIPNVTPVSFERTLNDDKTIDASDPAASCYKYDQLLKARKILKPMEGESTAEELRNYRAVTLLLSYKSPMWGIAARDMLVACRTGSYLTVKQQKKYGVYISEEERTKSADGTVVPPVVFVQCAKEPSDDVKAEFGTAKGYQRGDVHFTSWVAQYTATGITVHTCLLVDPCGSLPASLVAAFAGEQLRKFDILKKLVEKTGFVPLPSGSNTVAAAPTAGGGQGAASRSELPPVDTPTVAPRVVPGIDSNDASYKAFLSYYTSRHWEEKKHGDSATIQWYQMDSPNPSKSDKKAILFKTFVPGVTVWSFMNALVDDKSPNRDAKGTSGYTTDSLLSNKCVYKRVPPPAGSNGRFGEQLVLCSQYKSPVWGISAREMQSIVHEFTELTCSQKKKLGLPGDPLAVLQVGISAPPQHSRPPGKGHQRGEILCFGYLCQEVPVVDGGGVNIHLALHVDPSGSLPASVVDVTNGTQLVKVQLLKGLMVKRGPEGPPEGWSPIDDDEGAEIKLEVGKTSSPVVETASPAELPGPVKTYLDLLNSDGWEDPPTLNKKTPGISLTTKAVPWAKTKAAKLLFKIPAPASIAAAARVLQDQEFSKRMDKLIDTKEVLKTVNENLKITRTTYKSPMWGIAARDMVTYHTPGYYMDSVEERKKYGAPNQDRPDLKVFFTVGKDCEDKELPPQKGYTRSAVHVYGFMAAETDDGGLDCYNCYSSSPGGSMPAGLVDAANLAQFDKMEMIRQEITK